MEFATFENEFLLLPLLWNSMRDVIYGQTLWQFRIDRRELIYFLSFGVTSIHHLGLWAYLVSDFWGQFHQHSYAQLL